MSKFLLLLLLLSFFSCGDDSQIGFSPFLDVLNNDPPAEEEEEDTGPETLIISGIFAVDNNARDGKVFCIAQGEELSTCTAEIDDSDGSFACDGIHVDSPVTCFLRNSANDATLATIEFSEDDTVTYPGYLSRSTLAISLTGSVDLGNMTYDSTNPLISTVFSNIEEKASTQSSPINFDEIIDNQKTISCVTTGDSLIDNNCTAFIECTPDCLGVNDTLTIKKIPLTKNLQEINAYSIWAGEGSFANCGSKDLNSVLESQFTSEGFTLSEDLVIDSFSTGPNCLVDGWAQFEPKEPGNMYYLLNVSIPKPNSNATNLYRKDSWSYERFGQDCFIDYYNQITFYNNIQEEKIYGIYHVNKRKAGATCLSSTIFERESTFIFTID